MTVSPPIARAALVLGAAWLAGALGAGAQDWNPAAYRPVPFSQILDPPRTAPAFEPGGKVTPGFLEDLIKTEATFTGNRRPARTDPRLMAAWVLARGFKHDAPKAFALEYEFTDGTTVAWVPMFMFAAPDVIRPVKPGGRMELYVHRIALGQLAPAAVAIQARELP